MLGGDCGNSCCGSKDVYDQRGNENICTKPGTITSYGHLSWQFGSPSETRFYDGSGEWRHTCDQFAVDKEGVAYWTSFAVSFGYRHPTSGSYEVCPWLSFDRWKFVTETHGLTESGRLVTWGLGNKWFCRTSYINQRSGDFVNVAVTPTPLASVISDPEGLEKTFYTKTVPDAEPPGSSENPGGGGLVRFETEGFVHAIDVVFGGTGYDQSSPPAVRVSAAKGSGAKARALVSATGVVESVIVDAAGSGYPPAVSVAIDPPGFGDTATASAVVMGNVSSVEILQGGSYTSSPTVTAARADDDNARLETAVNSLQTAGSSLALAWLKRQKSGVIGAITRDSISVDVAGGNGLNGSTPSPVGNPVDYGIPGAAGRFSYYFGGPVYTDSAPIPRGKCAKGHSIPNVSDHVIGYFYGDAISLSVKDYSWFGTAENQLPQVSVVEITKDQWDNRPILTGISVSGFISNAGLSDKHYYAIIADTSSLTDLPDSFVGVSCILEFTGTMNRNGDLAKGLSAFHARFQSTPNYLEDPGCYCIVRDGDTTEPETVVEINFPVLPDGRVDFDSPQGAAGAEFSTPQAPLGLTTYPQHPVYRPGTWKSVSSLGENSFRAVDINGNTWHNFSYPSTRDCRDIDFEAANEIIIEGVPFHIVSSSNEKWAARVRVGDEEERVASFTSVNGYLRTSLAAILTPGSGGFLDSRLVGIGTGSNQWYEYELLYNGSDLLPSVGGNTLLEENKYGLIAGRPDFGNANSAQLTAKWFEIANETFIETTEWPTKPEEVVPPWDDWQTTGITYHDFFHDQSSSSEYRKAIPNDTPYQFNGYDTGYKIYGVTAKHCSYVQRFQRKFSVRTREDGSQFIYPEARYIDENGNEVDTFYRQAVCSAQEEYSYQAPMRTLATMPDASFAPREALNLTVVTEDSKIWTYRTYGGTIDRFTPLGGKRKAWEAALSTSVSPRSYLVVDNPGSGLSGLGSSESYGDPYAGQVAVRQTEISGFLAATASSRYPQSPSGRFLYSPPSFSEVSFQSPYGNAPLQYLKGGGPLPVVNSPSVVCCAAALSTYGAYITPSGSVGVIMSTGGTTLSTYIPSPSYSVSSDIYPLSDYYPFLDGIMQSRFPFPGFTGGQSYQRQFSSMMRLSVEEGYAGSGYIRPARIIVGNEYTDPSIPTGAMPYDSCLRSLHTVSGPGAFVAGVAVTSPGAGFRSPPQVSFASGSATAVAHTQGPIEGFNVSAAGSGYLYPPEVKFTGNGITPDPSNVVVELDSDGGVSSISFLRDSASELDYFPSDISTGERDTRSFATYNGSYSGSHPYPRGLYQHPPSITITPSPRVSSISVSSPGSLYQGPPKVEIFSDTGNAATAVAFISGPVHSIYVKKPGSDYTYPPFVVCSLKTTSPDADFDDDIPAASDFSVTLDGDGGVSSVSVLDGGNVHAPPEVKFVPVTGILDVDLTFGGSGYDPENPPTVTPNESGSYDDATFEVVVNSRGEVESIKVLSTGGHYLGLDTTLTIDPPAEEDGLQAEAAIKFGATPGGGAEATSAINGSVYEVSLTNGGYGYKDVEVFLTGGAAGRPDATKATATATLGQGLGSGAAASCLIDGRLLYIDVTSGGSGYSETPEVIITPENGASCQARILYRTSEYSATKVQDEYIGGALSEDNNRCVADYILPVRVGEDLYNAETINREPDFVLPSHENIPGYFSGDIPDLGYTFDVPIVTSGTAGTHVFPATELEVSGVVFCKEVFRSSNFYNSQGKIPVKENFYWDLATNISSSARCSYVCFLESIPASQKLSFCPSETDLSLWTSGGEFSGFGRNTFFNVSTEDSTAFENPPSSIDWTFPVSPSVYVEDVEATRATGTISSSSPSRTVSWSSQGSGKFRTSTTLQILEVPSGSWLGSSPDITLSVSQHGVIESATVNAPVRFHPTEDFSRFVIDGTGEGASLQPRFGRRVCGVLQEVWGGNRSSFISGTLGGQSYITGTPAVGIHAMSHDAPVVGDRVVFFGGNEIEPAVAEFGSYGINIIDGGLYEGTPEAYVISSDGAHRRLSVVMSREEILHEIEVIDGGRGYSQDSTVSVIKRTSTRRFYSHRCTNESYSRFRWTSSAAADNQRFTKWFAADPCGLLWQGQAAYDVEFCMPSSWLDRQDGLLADNEKRIETLFGDAKHELFFSSPPYYTRSCLNRSTLFTYKNGTVSGCVIAYPHSRPRYNQYFRTEPSSFSQNLTARQDGDTNVAWDSQTGFPTGFSSHSDCRFWRPPNSPIGSVGFPGECEHYAYAASSVFGWFSSDGGTTTR